MQLDVDFISKVLGNVHMQNSPFPQESSFSIDTRTIQKGDVFIALQGERVDGHDFVEEALAKGASGFILSTTKKNILLQTFGKQLSEKHLLFVDDTLQALVGLAKNWRS